VTRFFENSQADTLPELGGFEGTIFFLAVAEIFFEKFVKATVQQLAP
jgi:hypothetical protein